MFMRISTGCTIFMCVLLFTCIVAVYADDTVSVGDYANDTNTAALYSTTIVSGSYYGWGGSEIVLPGSQGTPVTGPYYGWGGSEIVLPGNQSTPVTGPYYGWGGGSEIVLPGNQSTGWHATKDLIHAQAQPSSGTVMNAGAWKSPSDLIRVQAGQGSTSISHVYNETNNGETINGLVTGDVVTIRLDGNPTTGFSWNTTLSPGITLFNSTYIRDPVPAGYTGGGGTYVWTLLLKQPGTQTFHGVYKQAWMPSSENDITYDLTFNVKGLGQY
jgi:predicted secreted protein